MIATIHGPVIEIRVDSLVVSLGGLGMSVQCAPDTIAQARQGDDVTLFTTLIVREDSLTLFGFQTADSRDLFELLQNVSGVGPRLAFGILATLPPDRLRQAIGSDDIATLKKVPGVGAKGAARLVLELKDRIGYAASGSSSSKSTHHQGWQAQVHGALVGLGWSAREAENAVLALVDTAQSMTIAGDEPQVADLLRLALQSLGRS